MANNYSKIKTLIFDDDKNWRMDLEDIAKKSGLIDIDVASSNLDSFGYLERNKYDLLILDTMQGSMEVGPNIAKKAFELGQKPKIIALSTTGSKPWEEKGIKYTFFNKEEFYARDLVQILEKIVKK